MASSSPLPQELVDKIIDELGEDYWDPDYKKHSDDRIDVACEALHACTLVSKNWAGRARTHLFKAYKIEAHNFRSLIIPPETVRPYVTELEIKPRNRMYRLSASPDLFTPFYACPIAHLKITSAALANAPVHLVEFITAISATLQTVTLEQCPVSLRLVHDIILAHANLKRLGLVDCKIKLTDSNHSTTPHSDTPHSTNVELGLLSAVLPPFGHDNHVPLVDSMAQLPIKFSKLNFKYSYLGLGMVHTANALIEANAGSLSSLTVHIWGSVPQDPGDELLLFSLKSCFNLSELTLDMKYTILCFISAFASILSTLDPTQHTRLESVRLRTQCLYQESRDRRVWSNIDTPLSELAKAVIDTKGKKLIFTLTSVCGGNCRTFGKKWLPELLPRFHGVGELRVEHERGDYHHPREFACELELPTSSHPEAQLLIRTPFCKAFWCGCRKFGMSSARLRVVHVGWDLAVNEDIPILSEMRPR
ncbi:hypothetical protein BJ322DRAFT_1024426 [Thelephora terrestris]|uniref:Uncharacterized protein n=1 Tax=Thelephora terrestris TaxID=56493 RepID=A0A9P6H4Z4_9AGAM|nr:hypothetical protein BJ322DRAFT_1024426 [Thelephora terrestris]